MPGGRENARMNAKAKSTPRFLLLAVAFMINCGIVVVPLEERLFKDRVEAKVPDDFPVLVLTTEEKGTELHPHIVRKENLESFLAKNPRHTFLVPLGEEERLRQELSRLPTAETGSKPFSVSFSVNRLSDGRQSFKVEYDLYDDLTNVGWYEATDKNIFPKYRKYHGDVGLLLVPAFFITVLIWSVASLVLWIGKRLVKKTGPHPTAP